MNLLEKHSIIIQLFTWILGMIFFLLGFKIELNTLISLICFFFIITFGISHGALDNLKGRKLFHILGFKNIFLFYTSYLTLSLIVILFWILFPTISLVIFLIVACYHFGEEDTAFVLDKNKNFKKYQKLKNFVYFSKGLLIIIAPLYFHNEETIVIFELLGANSLFILRFMDSLIWEYHKILIWIVITGYIIYFYMNFNRKIDLVHFFDFIPIVILNLALPPLIAFTIYFCFIHSFRHSVSLINFLDSANFINGLKLFVIRCFPLTLITAVLFILGVNFLINFYVLNDAILRVIFIGLASLTFPHILLEYLTNKYEKRS